jgi:hypothetical protein
MRLSVYWPWSPSAIFRSTAFSRPPLPTKAARAVTAAASHRASSWPVRTFAAILMPFRV